MLLVALTWGENSAGRFLGCVRGWQSVLDVVDLAHICQMGFRA